jgi:hypothetical protein
MGKRSVCALACERYGPAGSVAFSGEASRGAVRLFDGLGRRLTGEKVFLYER